MQLVDSVTGSRSMYTGPYTLRVLAGGTSRSHMETFDSRQNMYAVTSIHVYQGKAKYRVHVPYRVSHTRTSIRPLFIQRVRDLDSIWWWHSQLQQQQDWVGHIIASRQLIRHYHKTKSPIIRMQYYHSVLYMYYWYTLSEIAGISVGRLLSPYLSSWLQVGMWDG